ncbi:transposase [Rhodococcus rhodnii]|uniref:transposase n=1 Tax=Rhodococcus rhodnii TaxID=38312 RepID=UPI000A5B6A45|nr:transposase [Rhodococcus rhodnii]
MSRLRYPAAVRAAAVAAVRELETATTSQWAAIETVAADTGVHPSTIRTWLRTDTGPIPARPRHPDAELAELRAEVRALSSALQTLIGDQRTAPSAQL